MKNLKIFGIVMMLVMGMSFTSCSSDDDSVDGIWKRMDTPLEQIAVFAVDGTYTGYDYTSRVVEKARWTLIEEDGEKVLLINYPGGLMEALYVKQLTNNKLVLEGLGFDGDVVVFSFRRITADEFRAFNESNTSTQ